MYIYIILIVSYLRFFYLNIFILNVQILHARRKEKLAKKYKCVQKNGWVETNHSLTHHYFQHITGLFSSRYKEERSSVEHKGNVVDGNEEISGSHFLKRDSRL